MRAAITCLIGLVGSWGHAAAEPLLEGRVRLESGEPAVGAQVLLFDLADLRAAPVAATTDRSGHFTLPLAGLSGVLPERFELGANYPNPFNPSTMIPYQLPTAMYVRLEVFNILGQRVATLMDGEQPAGFHTVRWNATDASGEAVGAGAYLYRLSGDGVQLTRSMLLIDGQGGISLGGGGSTGLEDEAGPEADGEAAPIYGLTVSDPGLVPYVDPAFRVKAGMPSLDLVVEARGSDPSAKAASSAGILGDVDNTDRVDFFDALLVALYSRDASIVMPNNGDISLGDVDADGEIDLTDAWLIAVWLNDPSDPALPSGIGEPVGPAASLSPDPSTVTFADDGAWHRFTVEAGEPVSVVANPAGTPRLEITTRSGRGNFCPAEADDDISREGGQTLYLAGCASGTATVELRRQSDGTVLNTYTFEVTGSPADLVVQSVSVSDSSLTPGQAFTLRATVRNQGTGQSAATTLRYYRSTNARITTRDTQVGTDPVGALGASRSSAESIRLTSPSSAGTWYYGACVVSVAGESGGNNCSAGIRVRVEAARPDLIVASVSVSDSSLTPGQSFTLRATVRNQGTGRSAATTLRWYRSTNARISTRDSLVGTDQVGALAASDSSAESIRLNAPSSEGTYYYGACVASVAGEANPRNNCSAAVTLSVARTFSLSSDREALVALYHATDGPNWTNSTNWLSDKPVGDWHGVTVNLGRVGKLALEQNQLTGSIPAELGNLTSLVSLRLGQNQLTREIPPQLGHLTKLSDLSLGDNQLTGSIPVELGNLTNLHQLALGYNQLTGTIPPQLWQLTNLDYLHLGANQLTGEIPSQLGQLTNLGDLYLYGTVLTGEIPPELGQLTKLRYVNMANCLFTGEIPSELGQLANLKVLSLLGNHLTGEIPPELGQIMSLERLFLGSNQLTGEIPPELGQLTRLTHLDLSFNQLSGPLPEELIALPLEHFGLEETQVCVPRAAEFAEWLQGIGLPPPYPYCRDPQWDALSALYDGTGGGNWRNKTNWLSLVPLGEWYGVTTDADGRVIELNLEDNNLSGTVPLALGGLANLRRLNLAFNASLFGPLPQVITGLPLEEIRLQGTEVCAPPQAEFQEWLNGVSVSTGVTGCTDTRVDYYVLVDLYNATDGPNWTNAAKWASAAPLNEWHGVVTDPGGRVTQLSLGGNNLRGPLPTVLGRLTSLEFLSLSGNQLTGEIPSELGQLTKLSSLDLAFNQLTGEIPSELLQLTGLDRLSLGWNQLTGTIPSELGQLTKLEYLSLGSNHWTGEIPSELGQLTKLESLDLRASQLTGEIPSELARLANLTFLGLSNNQLTGEIPSELGQLINLSRLDLSFNQLTGEIPSELGQLTSLAAVPFNPHIPPLDLSGNQLTGEIPPELGQLTNLSGLNLSTNKLTGEIPSELGQLTTLSDLNLSTNQLTGEIFPELGRLTNLSNLNLSTNRLTGEIPPELGKLTNLSNLNLSSNQLTGNVPPELGDLGNLRSLNLAYNGALSGTLPHGLTRLTLENLSLQETFLCPPQDADFQSWLFGIPASRIRNCARVDASTAYLTQATQSLEFPVPLVAGEAALLRVFVTAAQDVDATLPPVRATFYRDGGEVHTAEMEGGDATIPWQVNEADLWSSANAVVPGSVVMPGLEMVVEIDPDQTLDAALGVGARLPPTGRTALNVRSVPPFDLTLVPFLWTEDPDSTVLTRTEGLTRESDLFRLTRDLLPVGDFSLTVHEPVWTSVDPTSDANAVLGPETELIYAMEGAMGFYMAIFRSQGDSGLKGQAQTPGSVSLSILDANTIAHELGHNLSLDHAPGCGAGWPDPEYPYEDGSIGSWGYDFLNETLVNPGTSDIMTYCDLQWISEFSFAKAMGYHSRSVGPRLAAKYSTPPHGLLLWGGLNESGVLFLEPAFVVGAPPLPPGLDGPYQLTGEDDHGNNLFSLPFGMPEYGCGGRGGSFAFILPVGRDWPDRLARIVLSGPEGYSILDGEEDPSATLLLNPTTGRVRGVLRDWPDSSGKGVAGKRLAASALPEPGLEVLTSRGLPDPDSWAR